MAADEPQVARVRTEMGTAHVRMLYRRGVWFVCANPPYSHEEPLAGFRVAHQSGPMLRAGKLDERLALELVDRLVAEGLEFWEVGLRYGGRPSESATAQLDRVRQQWLRELGNGQLALRGEG